ncbi:hypothetical protein MLD38_034106 [Melastoma candidum]|uniref:Uncharacterized protein n=1 Tax=Melastoma candidum TaxID=119954 RepID=A0ACB9MBI0_9MYRT|nr:hypothetical protein MLD38_034106 [Melastoma candidum]
MGTVDSPQKSPFHDDPSAATCGLGKDIPEIRGSGRGEGAPVGRDGGSTSENDGLADFEMNGVSSLLKMKESNRRGTPGRDKIENLNSLLGSMDVDGKGGGVEGEKAIDGEFDGGKARDGGIGEDGGSVCQGDRRTSLDLNSDGLAEDVYEDQYSVGDLVWGKIKNHPWWPGQIYDPVDASQYAVKHRTSSNKILVAYFGDGTFAWCHPSQLKPFEENFDAFSRQSASRNFSNAINAVLNEICRVINLSVTCPCVPGRSEDSSGRRKLVANSGIKEGAFVPDNGIEKLAVCRLGTSELILSLRKMACTPSASSMLYSAVLKNWLVPFYKLKGVSQLPDYYEPVPVPGLEDRGDALGDGMGNGGVPFQGPVVEEWQSLAQKESTLKKCAGMVGEEVSSRRKEKSILEILGLNGKGADNKTSMKKMEDEHPSEDRNEVVSKTVDEDVSGQSVVEMKGRGRKKKASGGDINGGSEVKVGSGGPVMSEAKVDVHDCNQGDLDKGSYLRERKKSKYLSPPFTNVTKGHKKKDKEAEPLNASGITRVAEKMKRAANHLMGTPLIFEKKADVKVSEFESQAGDDEISEQRIPTTSEEEQHLTAKAEELKPSASNVLNEVRGTSLDPNHAMEARSVSADVEMLLPLYRSSVSNNGSNCKNFKKGNLGRKKKCPETELPSTTEGAQIDQCPDIKPQKEATKEVAQNPEPEEVVAPKSDGEPQRRKSEIKPQKKRAIDEVAPISDSKPRKRKETPEAGPKSDAKPQKKKASEDATTLKSKTTPKSRLLGKAAAKDDIGWLLVTFKQASSLPTKEDLITMYSKYGKLDENETVVHYNSKYALVVFEKISDAEEALKCSQAASPFGSSKAEFELLCANSTPYGTDEQKVGVPRKRGRPRKAGTDAAIGETSTVTGDTSEVQSMKRKLENISSLLDKSGGKLSKKVRSHLRDEIKGLLELASPPMDGSASS